MVHRSVTITFGGGGMLTFQLDYVACCSMVKIKQNMNRCKVLQDFVFGVYQYKPMGSS